MLSGAIISVASLSKISAKEVYIICKYNTFWLFSCYPYRLWIYQAAARFAEPSLGTLINLHISKFDIFMSDDVSTVKSCSIRLTALFIIFLLQSEEVVTYFEKQSELST